MKKSGDIAAVYKTKFFNEWGNLMKLKTLVWREMFERKNQLATSFFAIFLGITAVVAIKNITFFSEKAVAREMDALGANILVLPKSATVQDYYSADMQNEVFPEDYVDRLIMSDLQGLDNLSPKLSMEVQIGGNKFILTGILPKSEFRAKAMWKSAGLFSRPKGCGAVEALGKKSEPRETLVRKRVINTLKNDEVLLGADTAAVLKIGSNEKLELLGRKFMIKAILPQTGTVDDSRIFAHLHTVQQMSHKGEMLNVIEVVGCCREISAGLVQKINKLLPEAKVVTISQIVETQYNMNRMMTRLSVIFLLIIVLVGGASIANYMYANVFERRREIGTLMAMGANAFFILKIFLLKAFLLGLAGGVAGYFAGTALAVTLGPKLAKVTVIPMPALLLWAVGISLLIALVASYFPARRATRLDPCAVLQEA